MLRGKSLESPKEGIKLRPTSAHAKATWASEVSLANHIPPLIKLYQAPIPLIPCKFHSTYPVINPETGFFPITITNH
jgi:hypothetical protein